MAIYLGTNELGGGGGGSIPVGGVRYFIPPSGTTFTSGQEVYTDPDDSTVWLRSGARIDSTGTGALDASIYSDAIETFADTGDNATVSYTSSGNRFGAAYLGSGIVGVNGFINNNSVRWGITDAGTRAVIASDTYASGLFDGVRSTSSIGSSSGPLTSDSFTFKGAAANDTHFFIGGNTASGYFKWGAQNGGRFVARYFAQSILTSSLGHASLYDNSSTFLVPSTFTSSSNYSAAGLYMAITNAGTSNERHWFLKENTTSIVEHTFNSSTANGGEPWTATGNSIDLSGESANSSAATVFSMQGLGNTLYVKSSSTVMEFNATTRAKVKQFEGLPSNDNLMVIPASEAQSGAQESWFNPASSSSCDIYAVRDNLTAPYIGTYAGTRTPIVLTDNAGTAASDGRDTTSETDVYLWMRIA